MSNSSNNHYTSGNVYDKREAKFTPDLNYNDLMGKGVLDQLYNKTEPRLASMEKWPKEWGTKKNPKGWLEWYKKWSSGERDSEEDYKQQGRWIKFKAKQVASFKKKPSPKRAFALVNWGIDPLKLLDKSEKQEFKDAMSKYRRSVMTKAPRNEK